MVRILRTGLCLLALWPWVLPAAEFSAGLKGGGNLENLWGLEQGLSSPKLGGAGGLFAKIGILGMFAIQPEILYARKGGKRSDQAPGDPSDPFGRADTTRTTTLHFEYLEFPLLVKIFPPGTDYVRPHLLLGPYYAILLDSRFETGGSVKQGSTIFGLPKAAQRSELPGAVADSDFGVVAGFGVDWGLGTIDLRYTLGLNPLFPESEDDSKTGTLTLQMGFLIKY